MREKIITLGEGNRLRIEIKLSTTDEPATARLFEYKKPFPTLQSEFPEKIQIGGKDMEGKRPKRRKDKYNPYTIYEKNGYYFVSFEDGQGVSHILEIGKTLYETFDSFELDDLVYLNVLDRHIEQSEVWESTLNARAVQKPESTEDIVFRRIQIQELHRAIAELPEVQRRRIVLYYFEEMTYEQIARKEHCSFQAVAKSIVAAEKRIKKILK